MSNSWHRSFQGRKMQRMGTPFYGFTRNVLWGLAWWWSVMGCVCLEPFSWRFTTQLLKGTSKARFADIQMVQICHPMPSRPETWGQKKRHVLLPKKIGTRRRGYWIVLLLMNLAMVYLSVLTAFNCAEECCMSSSLFPRFNLWTIAAVVCTCACWLIESWTSH